MNEVRSNVVSGEAKVLAFQNRGCIITIYFIYTLIYIYIYYFNIYIYIIYYCSHPQSVSPCFCQTYCRAKH